MPYRCCAVNCKGNYKNGPKVPVLSFPKDANLRRRSLQAPNRKDFVITANSRLCIQHFSEDLVIKESSFVDSTTGNIIKTPLLHFKLKEGAVPTIFPGCPGYITKGTLSREMHEEKLKSAEMASLNMAIQDSLKSNEEYEKNHFFSDCEEFKNLLKELNITLATDASPVGVAAVLSHIIDNVEKSVAFASRSLTEAERNYSQLDREALAIIFGVFHFINYIYGQHFVLITDNQPLSRIFHPKTGLPKMTSARLLSYASFLAGFDYTVKFREGFENQNVDCLSRAPVNQNCISADVSINDEVHQVCASAVFEISSKNLTADAIIQETEEDQELAQIKQEPLSSPINSDYILNSGILFKNNHIVIPKTLQSTILNELHSTHIGITKMKQLVRRYCIWKIIDKDIENLVKSCKDCSSVKHSPAKALLHHRDLSINNWDRIHIDYAGPFHYLIVVDAKSRWVEIKVLLRLPNSKITMKLLNEIFTTH
ncbi:Uncharacterized protein K02A2.6 [Araneus ventricosus]|uniref:RNA-directed DNA polymerase n=1 Tax=Araneus ventricosus TaxID=182803 RepID=A0A4Y2APY4_ARAVE|nr:Uncharacterized protein K02A2.6 [Araneus ventricosus]